MAALAQHAPAQEASFAGLALPITIRPAAPITDDELLLLSSQNPSCRIELNAKGELQIMSPAGGEGGEWETEVIRQLANWADQHDGRAFSSNTGFRLVDGSVLSPDASWVSSGRWAALTKDQRRKYPPLCPDFVLEIRSASDSRPALEAKMHLWIANGAQLAWLLDPEAQTAAIYRPGRSPELLTRPETIEAGQPIPGFRLTLAKLWDL